MLNHPIFEAGDEECCKDIIFFAPHTCMVIQVVHIALDAGLMPSCPNLFTVCH